MVPADSTYPRLAAAVPAVLAVLLCLAPTAEAGKLYRWVDEDGHVHYTDRMPADASDEAHQVMDETGTVKEEKESAAVERERRREREAEQAEERRRAEQERLAEQERRRKDRIILQTFVTERDIKLTRANRVEAVQVQINIAEHGIEQLESRRADLRQNLERLPADSPAAETNRERLAEAEMRLRQRRADKAHLEKQRAEIESLFDHYLERFRELNE